MQNKHLLYIVCWAEMGYVSARVSNELSTPYLVYFSLNLTITYLHFDVTVPNAVGSQLKNIYLFKFAK